MTMTPDEAREVAGRLTKAQKAAVIRGQGFSRTVWAIYRFRPALFASASSSGGEGFLCRPTDLGAAVRRILQENRDGE